VEVQKAEASQRVIHVPAETRPVLWVAEGDADTGCAVGYRLWADGGRLAGAIAFVEVTVPIAGGPPMHVHPNTDEAYHLLAGELEVVDREHTLRVRPGDFILVPSGVAHAYRSVGDEPARMRYLLLPPATSAMLVAQLTGHHAFT
jgi:mannose-6-phosphate isomerase-like protein (cupin superfamily)